MSLCQTAPLPQDAPHVVRSHICCIVNGDLLFSRGKKVFLGGVVFFVYIPFLVWIEANYCVCECEVFICFQHKKLRKAWKRIRKKEPANEQGLLSR